MTEARLTLRSGPLEVDLLPALGGSIARFDLVTEERRQSLFRGSSDPIDDVLDAACFPLVPYANRIRGGAFNCDGREVRLSPNLPGDNCPLHGQGWRAVWKVIAAHEDRATLSYQHAADEWPWEYEATQQIALDGTGLSLELSCRNLSANRMPCGLGFHPYYPCSPTTMLDTSVLSAWTVDAAVLPVENVPALGRYNLHNRLICGQALDNGFDGWDGEAKITWPGMAARLRLSSPDAGRFQVYSPATGGLFVAEPVQNANTALNANQTDWDMLGITTLRYGQTARLRARFDVLPS